MVMLTYDIIEVMTCFRWHSMQRIWHLIIDWIWFEFNG
jgi:hypothetical protein